MLGKSPSRWPLHDTAELPRERERKEGKGKEGPLGTNCLQSPICLIGLV